MATLCLRMETTVVKPARKNCTIRARCDTETKLILGQAAVRIGLDQSDILRIAVRQYATRIGFQLADAR